MGDLLKTATVKMYLAGWNHYPEGQIRNALYLHLLEGSESMEWDKAVTVTVRIATEDGIRQVSWILFVVHPLPTYHFSFFTTYGTMRRS